MSSVETLLSTITDLLRPISPGVGEVDDSEQLQSWLNQDSKEEPWSQFYEFEDVMAYKYEMPDSSSTGSNASSVDAEVGTQARESEVDATILLAELILSDDDE